MSFYCRHGLNIGPPGGYDYLCQFCESTEPDPSPNDFREMIKQEEEGFEELLQLVRNTFCDLVVLNGSISASVAVSYIHQSFSDITLRRVAELKSNLEEARKWAKDDDDNMWMFTRHYHHQEEIARLEREEADYERERRASYLAEIATIEDESDLPRTWESSGNDWESSSDF